MNDFNQKIGKSEHEPMFIGTIKFRKNEDMVITYLVAIGNYPLFFFIF